MKQMISNAIEFSTKHLYDEVVDYQFSSTMLVEPRKVIQTGKIRTHYRFSDDFIIAESVLHGFAKKFLDGIKIFTSTGCLVVNIYRIRSKEYTNGASFEVVQKELSKYLHTKENIDEFLDKTMTLLYDSTTQKDAYDAVKAVQSYIK